MKKYLSSLLFFIAAMLWGFAFSAQKDAASLSAFTIGTVRNIFATVFLLLAIPFLDKFTKNGRRLISRKKFLDFNKYELIGGTICGVILTVAAVKPLLTMRITGVSDVMWSFQAEAERITEQATLDTQKKREEIIIERLRTYILDKAASLGANIEVEILLDRNEIGLPVGVIIHGNISPYGKQRLTEILASEIGIEREYQQWMN